jgi:hypothetical protein
LAPDRLHSAENVLDMLLDFAGEVSERGLRTS